MNHPRQANPWAEINGGLRGSTLLASGGLLTILATLQNFASILLNQPGEQIFHTLVTSAWLCWILALWLLAAGFIWIGVQPFLSRIGLLVGAFHLVNGALIFGTLFLDLEPPVPGVSLSIGRTLLLLFFALAEKKHIKPIYVNILVIASLGQFLKIGLRIMEVIPPLNPILEAGFDSGILILIAISLILVSKSLKKAENSWATELAATRASGFGEFNNPEHDWNQEKS